MSDSSDRGRPSPFSLRLYRGSSYAAAGGRGVPREARRRAAPLGCRTPWQLAATRRSPRSAGQVLRDMLNTHLPYTGSFATPRGVRLRWLPYPNITPAALDRRIFGCLSGQSSSNRMGRCYVALRGADTTRVVPSWDEWLCWGFHECAFQLCPRVEQVSVRYFNTGLAKSGENPQSVRFQHTASRDKNCPLAKFCPTHFGRLAVPSSRQSGGGANGW